MEVRADMKPAQEIFGERNFDMLNVNKAYSSVLLSSPVELYKAEILTSFHAKQVIVSACERFDFCRYNKHKSLADLSRRHQMHHNERLEENAANLPRHLSRPCSSIASICPLPAKGIFRETESIFHSTNVSSIIRSEDSTFNCFQEMIVLIRSPHQLV